MKIEKLTRQQIEKIAEVRDGWLSLIFDCNKEVDIAEATKGIDWLYSFCNLKKPIIIFVDSPLGIQYAVNMMKTAGLTGKEVEDQIYNEVWNRVRNQVGDQVWNQVGDQVRTQVRNQVRTQVGTQVRTQVENQVWNQVWDQVWNQVGNEVGTQVGDQVGDQVWNQVGTQQLEFFNFALFGNVSDFGWVAFYDGFEKIGVELANDNFGKFRNLITSGIYDMIQLDGLCVVCGLPSKVNRTEVKGTKRLHSEKEVAIEFADGYKQHYLWGVYFNEDLWKKVVSKKLTFKEIMALENMEQRMVALKLYDPEQLLAEAKAIKLNESKRGNELYEVKDIFPQTEYFLKYTCPSTGRVYVKCVDQEAGSKNDADYAQAWSLSMTKDEYLGLTLEA